MNNIDCYSEIAQLSEESLLGGKKINASLKHVGIIMDGNSRWALKNSRPKMDGYRKGAEVAFEIIHSCLNLGIKYLTLYTFSSENWQRNKGDIGEIFSLFNAYFDEYVKDLLSKGVIFKFIGDIESLPESVRARIYSLSESSQQENLCVLIAISYGSRQEILSAVKKVILLNKNADEVDLEFFSSLLYTDGIPNPDLIIRTSGEKRLSNFLLWQSAYSELYFCNTLWPDFNSKHFIEALNDYKSRERKYGK